MPATAAFLDDLAAAFGEDAIWPQVEKGFAGEPTFFAIEGGVRAGTRNTVHTSAIAWDQRDMPYSTTPGWIKDARAFAAKRGIDIKAPDPNDESDLRREANELRNLINAAKSKGKTQ